MNLAHLRAFLWLRFTLSKRQLSRSDAANRVLSIVFYTLGILAAIGLAIGGFFLGYSVIPNLTWANRLLIWNGLVVMFLFVRFTGILHALQRSEPLSIDRFLHLPVSPRDIFALNYASSLFDLTWVMFYSTAGAMLLGQCISMGAIHLLAVVPLAAFAFMLSALQYQFQGWLAVLMSNPRRRRTVILAFTMGILLIAQAPNLINMFAWPWETKPTVAMTPPPPIQARAEAPELPLVIAPAKPPVQLEVKQSQTEQLSQEFTATIQTPLWWASAVLPVGWFPLAVVSIGQGNWLAFALSTLGLVLIGTLCLTRAYRTTLRYYTGGYTHGDGTATPQPLKQKKPSNRTPIAEWNWPWLPERVGAVASATLQGMIRAPEAKMILLVPIVMSVVLVGFLLTSQAVLPVMLRPFLGLGFTAFICFCGLGITGNMFGFDRAGFRALVLSPVPRDEIFYGRNVGYAVLFLGLSLIGITALCVLYPPSWHQVPAVLLVSVCVYLATALLTNALSIIAPIPIAAGAMRPTEVKLVPVALQLAFVTGYPLLLGLVALPFLIELALNALDLLVGWPVALVLSLVELPLVYSAYRRILRSQGAWLLRKEMDILITVTTKNE